MGECLPRRHLFLSVLWPSLLVLSRPRCREHQGSNLLGQNQPKGARAHLNHLGVIQPLAQHLLDELEDLLQYNHHLKTRGEVRCHCHAAATERGQATGRSKMPLPPGARQEAGGRLNPSPSTAH